MAADLMGLSNRVRSENLAALKPLGSWELARLARDEGRPLPKAPARRPLAADTFIDEGTSSDATTRAAARPSPAAKPDQPPQKIITAEVNTMSKHGRDEAAPPTSTTKDITMPATVQIDGTCGLCDKKARTKLVKGVFCCATCLTIRYAARKHPALILAQVREFHPELLAPLSSAPAATPAAACELAEAHTALADSEAQNKALGASNVDLVRQLHDMEVKNEDLRNAQEYLRPENKRLSHLVQELGQANINQKQKLRDLEAFQKEIFSLQVQETNQRQWAEIHNLLAEINGLQDILEAGSGVTATAAARQRMSELQYLRNQPGPSQELLALQGELAGLQDVLTAWEQERAALLEEQGRLAGQVRWLHEQLAATERKAAGLEQEVDRLQECTVGTITSTSPVGEALPLIEDGPAGQKLTTAGASILYPPGYGTLTAVLCQAIDQASAGKGLDRHATAGEPFDRQKICEITRRGGLGFPLGQAIKKAEESLRLGTAGLYELLGAINYLAAAHICMSELVQRDQALEQAA